MVIFTNGKSLDDYENDLMLRSAVERQFEIIGEALNKSIKIEASLENEIESSRDIINFRNLIVHGYNIIENKTVWGIIENHLPVLYEQVNRLLQA